MTDWRMCAIVLLCVRQARNGSQEQKARFLPAACDGGGEEGS